MPEPYVTALPIRPGWVVEIGPLPSDLTAQEVERVVKWLRRCVVPAVSLREGR